MYPAFIRKYVISALEATPVMLGYLLEGMTEEEADRRPDASRFTLREVIAHLADFEGIFGGRIERMLREDRPEMSNVDEGQLAVDHDYPHTDWKQNLESFTRQRSILVARLKELPEADWDREGVRPEIGVMTVGMMASLIAHHDAYHLRQAIEWRRKKTG